MSQKINKNSFVINDNFWTSFFVWMFSVERDMFLCASDGRVMRKELTKHLYRRKTLA
jgi:hypothetical protein